MKRLFPLLSLSGGESRCLIFIVAYQAETTIANVVSRIPALLADRYEIDILIIDDSSKDKTFENSYQLSAILPSLFKFTHSSTP